MAGKGLQKPAFNPLFSGRIQVPQQLPQPCGIAVLLPGRAGEGDAASPLGSRGNQSQPGSSEIPHQIPSSLPRQLPQFIPLEKQGISHLGHTQQLHPGMLQVPGTDTHRCAQLWGKTLLQQGNDQQQDQGWVCAAPAISCRAAGTTHSSQAASTDLTLGITAARTAGSRSHRNQH